MKKGPKHIKDLRTQENLNLYKEVIEKLDENYSNYYMVVMYNFYPHDLRHLLYLLFLNKHIAERFCKKYIKYHGKVILFKEYIEYQTLKEIIT